MRRLAINCSFAFVCLTTFGFFSWRSETFRDLLQSKLQLSTRITRQALGQLSDPARIPVTVDAAGRVKTANIYDWRSGFFAGNLWYLYEHTKDSALLLQAKRWTAALEPLKDFKDHHDLGFMVYCSYGNGYRLTGDPRYREIIIQAARSLCTRFDQRTGSIKSWNTFKSWSKGVTYHYPVIIDNMMNLELLFFAAKETGDPYFRQVAITHADNTLKHHFRKDYSAYHVVMYDTLTGGVIAKESAQGYGDESAWARGQAWALYGFTTTYRETKNKRYLQQARGIAGYLMNHPNLPADKVPFWDYHAGVQGAVAVNSNAEKFNGATQPRDASAAAIMASALIELSGYVPRKEGRRMYAFAKKIITSLSSPGYLADPGTNANFILKHSVGSIPHGGEIDVPLIYADYYYIEAMMRALAREEKSPQ